ncbi:MAG: hypothetical protein LW710_11345 [Burkholderiales bacterium]|jgi:hypothetical protein|uniref:hypothetical protein n=1 Tax=Limnobacter sp. TaxID=2003368 RepID=UPI0039BC4149|nr:hypothetical protein [Burkholderiales bacterium]
MKRTSKIGLAAGAALLLTVAACGGDGIPFNIGTASSDGNISAGEASALVGRTSETGEPDNVGRLTLATSETDEPFDLAD